MLKMLDENTVVEGSQVFIAVEVTDPNLKHSCKGCAFYGRHCFGIKCTPHSGRTDNKYVIFKLQSDNDGSGSGK